MIHQKYVYQATIERVVDGDTVDVLFDLGFGNYRRERLRLNRIDAWERRGEEREKGIEATDYLTELIEGERVTIQTVKDKKGKYGRYLAEIWTTLLGGVINVNDALVSEGHAEFRSY